MTTLRQRWVWRGVAVSALGVAVLATVTTGPFTLLAGTVTGSSAADRPAPCLPGRAVPILDSPHVTPAEADSANYNSDPPTSGPHFAFVAPPGIYAEPVADGLAVHALEHGHVVIQYGPDVPEQAITALHRLAKRYSGDVLLAPRPSLGRDIALTAWGRIDRFDRFDEQRTIEFIQALRDRYDHGWKRNDDCAAG